MRLNSSFRDPSGFVFTKDSTIYRQVNRVYKSDYDHLMGSGLYKKLVAKKLLVAHQEVHDFGPEPETFYKCIKPEQIPFISYPYEWSFSQLRRAALITLRIQKLALEHDMTLKDASAFNVQHLGFKPIFIDTLSFTKYEEDTPWVAYRQFCQHFLAPLALLAYSDTSLYKLSRVHLDGVPLPLASKLLPRWTYLKMGLLFHLHLHARMQKRYQSANKATYKQRLPKKKLLLLIDSLEDSIKSINWKPEGTEWGDYYEHTNYSATAFDAKTTSISEAIDTYQPKTVWDIGGNTGRFSRIASERGISTICFDIDEAAVEKNYRETVEKQETHLLPLILDVSNASPGLGWMFDERKSLVERGPADMTIAVALIHHLTIGGNAPFSMVARFFATFSKVLVIEFVPKDDSQVQKLLASREDIFTEYNQTSFEAAFSKDFEIKAQRKVEDSKRIMYTMERKT